MIVLAVGAVFGLRALSRPASRTEEEFERQAAESTMLGAGINALQQITDPAEARAKQVRVQMKDGRYLKRKREGKAGGTDSTE